MNSFGRIFRISIFGESHGTTVGVVIDGCPSGISISEEDLMADLARRKSGGLGTTPRNEPDLPKIVSGVFKNFTTGAPITILFENTNTRSHDYTFRDIPRPGHADYTSVIKFGQFTDYRGGGHFSGRLTLGIVAAGVIAKKIIDKTTVSAQLLEVGGSTNIEEAVKKALEENDSIGGLVECTINNVQSGLGEPFFDSVEARISHLIFSIPAIKGIEFGSGFGAVKMKGSEHNDTFIDADGKTLTNNAAGINGGITNGNEIVFRVAVKPTSSIGKPQQTFNFATSQMDTLEVKGRHDACIALRIPVIIEAVAAIVMADLKLVKS